MKQSVLRFAAQLWAMLAVLLLFVAAALPADAVQASVSVAVACALLYVMRLIALRKRFNLAGEKSPSAPPYVRDCGGTDAKGM